MLYCRLVLRIVCFNTLRLHQTGVTGSSQKDPSQNDRSVNINMCVITDLGPGFHIYMLYDSDNPSPKYWHDDDLTGSHTETVYLTNELCIKHTHQYTSIYTIHHNLYRGIVENSYLIGLKGILERVLFLYNAWYSSTV